jgi:hypothetical protein
MSASDPPYPGGPGNSGEYRHKGGGSALVKVI